MRPLFTRCDEGELPRGIINWSRTAQRLRIVFTKKPTWREIYMRLSPVTGHFELHYHTFDYAANEKRREEWASANH